MKEAANVEADDLKLYLAQDDKGWVPSSCFPTLLRGGVPRRFWGLMEQGTIDATKKIKDAIGEHIPPGTIHVLVDSPLRQFEWWIGLDMKTIGNFRPYEPVAERLKDHPQVKELEQQLLILVPGMRTLPSPFVMLECSSGMGKTQMAFNLQASGACDVFHIVCGAAGDNEQLVYRPLHGRSMAFNVCAKRDADEMETGKLHEFYEDCERHLYAFLVAVLRGDIGFSATASRADVEDELKLRRERGDKPCVFFLDEFPRVHLPDRRCAADYIAASRSRQEKYLRAMRNVILSFKLPLVVSSTSGTGRGLPSSHEGQNPWKWCDVYPSLPATSLDEAYVRLNNVSEEFKRLVQYSRPLFSDSALIKTDEHRSDDLGDFLGNIVDRLGPAIRYMKRPSEAFELGQFGLLLGCDFSLEDECTSVVDAHYACLKVLKPFVLILKATDILWRDGKRWKPIGAFPPPESDMVLHLALTSGNSFRPLKQPLYQMMEWPAMKNMLMFDTDRQRSGQVMRFEALVTASIVLASRSGGVHGAGLSSFLGAMLYELGVASEIEATQSSLDVEDALLSQVFVPFLSPPNAAWPDWFLSDWENTSANFANLFFSADAKSGRLDFRVSSGATSFECSRSMKLSELDQVMDRIPLSLQSI